MDKKNLVEGVSIGALLHSACGNSTQMHTCIPPEGTLDRGRATRPMSACIHQRESVGTQELAKDLSENGGQTATLLTVLCEIKLAECASTPWWESTKVVHHGVYFRNTVHMQSHPVLLNMAKIFIINLLPVKPCKLQGSQVPSLLSCLLIEQPEPLFQDSC